MVIEAPFKSFEVGVLEFSVARVSAEVCISLRANNHGFLNIEILWSCGLGWRLKIYPAGAQVCSCLCVIVLLG